MRGSPSSVAKSLIACAFCLFSNYEIPEKEPFNPDKDASKIWTNINGTTGDTANAQAQYKWYGTVLGKNTVSSNYVIIQSTEGGLTFMVKETTNKGKVESTNDSIAAVFRNLDLLSPLHYRHRQAVRYWFLYLPPTQAW